MRPRPHLAGLYGIVGPDPRLAGALLSAGVKVLQLRDKRASGRELVASARHLRDLAHRHGALFLVNDRLDVALLSGADGVHLGQDDLPVDDARQALDRLGRDRSGFLLGLSTHDLAQVREAVRLQVDYLGFGPIFATTTKPDALAPRGCERLAEAVRAAGGLPVVAIGGIGLANVDGVVRAGAAMAAVISDLAGHPHPSTRARELQERFQLARS